MFSGALLLIWHFSILLDCPRSRWLSTLSYISRERFEVVNKRRPRTGKGTISFMCRGGTLMYIGVYSCFYSIPSCILPVYLGCILPVYLGDSFL